MFSHIWLGFELFPIVQVAKAKETEQKIDVEIKELQATLANIDEARPFDQLTVCAVYMFHIAISHSNARLWMSRRHTPVLLRPWRRCSRRANGLCQVLRFPSNIFVVLTPSSGYKEKFGDLNLM